MSLEALFKDRNARQNIRTSIREATEIGFSNCDFCGKEESLMSVFGHNLCESCCNRVMEASYDFDRVFEEDVNESNVEGLLTESYVIPDMNKLQSMANSKFNGSVPDLMKSYGMNPHPDWDDRIQKGMIFIRDNNITGGKTRVNQFLIDFDCSFTTLAAAQKLVPDKDGTSAPMRVKGKQVAGGAQPASHTNISTQSASHTVQSNIQAGPGIKASGSGQTFDVKITSKLTLNCTKTNKSQGNKVDIEVVAGSSGKCNMLIEDGTNDQIANRIIDMVKQNPSLIFPSFEGEGIMKDGYKINKYPAYSFKFDNKSFDGNNVSLILNLNDKPYEKSRVYLSNQALFKRVKLDSELRDFMDDKLKRIYPMLFNGVADVKTSVGKAVTELTSIESNPSCKMGEAHLKTELGNSSIDWKVNADRFNDKEITHNTVCDILLKLFDKIIPGWSDTSIDYNKTKYTKGFKIDGLDVNGHKFNLVAGFDLSELYDKGQIGFYITVADTASGKEYSDYVEYHKPGVGIKDFLSREGEKIYSHNFKESDMVDKLTISARDKMENPSKKEAFLYKVADIFMNKVRKKVSDKDLEDLSCHIERFDVNKHGKITDCEIRVYDEDGYVADNSLDLQKSIQLDNNLNFLKVKKVDSSPAGMSEYGPSVVYTVSDINKFSLFVDFTVLESAMFEAFGVTYVNESGRKQIFV